MPTRGPSAETAPRFSDTGSARRTGRWEPRPRGCERTVEEQHVNDKQRTNEKARAVQRIDVTAAARNHPTVPLGIPRQGRVNLET